MLLCLQFKDFTSTWICWPWHLTAWPKLICGCHSRPCAGYMIYIDLMTLTFALLTLQVLDMWYVVGATLPPRLKMVWSFICHLWRVLCLGYEVWGVRFMRCGDLDLWPKIVLLITLAMDSAHTRLEHSAIFYSWVIAPMAHTDGRK